MCNDTSFGVIVGRFQVASLHNGHKDLINYVAERHPNVLIVLGVSRSFATPHDPLSFEMRETMIWDCYPQVKIAKIYDHPSDEKWSIALDELIKENCGGNRVTLYGSRDSFLDSYSGVFPKEFFPVRTRLSGTEIRKAANGKPKMNEDFFSGVIFGQANRLPVVYPAVDTAVINQEKREVLLGGKDIDGDKLRFIGGFVDAYDQSYELAAKREVLEETSHIELDDFRYVGSFKVDDWRYRGCEDGIMTILYRANYVFGHPTPSDDIVRLEWVKLENLLDRLVDEHRPLGDMLIEGL